MATPDGKGYWVLLSDGEVFAYGDAANGLTGSAQLQRPRPGHGHLRDLRRRGLLGRLGQGNVFNYGDAPSDGGMTGTHLNGSIIAASGS